MNEALFTNREIASLVLLSMLLLLAVAGKKKSRNGLSSSLRSVLRSIFSWKIAIPLLLYSACVIVALIPASLVGLWEQSLWKATAIWFLMSGLGLVFGFPNAIKDPRFFRRALRRTIRVVAVFEFVTNLASFPLWIEIPTQVLAFLCIVSPALGPGDADRTRIVKLAHICLILYGMSALAWATLHLAREWSGLNHHVLALECFLPIWLTPVALLFVYPLTVIAAYESAFVKIRFAAKGRRAFNQRLALVLRAGGSLRILQIVETSGAWRIGRTSGLREAWREVRQILLEHRARVASEAAAERRLLENAGLAEVDESGKQLDRREHNETMEALRYLSTCQMGHYRSRGREYHADLVKVVENLPERYGLPGPPNGVRMHVSPDGQRWYAERETITGHWFAIGASGPPPDEWFYDGSTKPTGYPDESDWDHWAGGEHAANWD